MGGTYAHTQKNLHKPEHNYMRARNAFNFVVDQGIPIYVTPRDITLDLFLDPKVLEDKKDNSHFQRAVYQLSQRFLSYFDRDDLRISDAICVGSLAFPHLFTGERVRLVREKGREGESFYCQPDNASTITAFTDFNRRAFYSKLIERL